MGLKEIFQSAAKTAITAFGNIPHSVTYTNFGDMTYDDVTKVKTIPETDYPFDMIFTAMTQDEILKARNQGINVLPTDTKGLAPTLDLPIEPSPKDKLEDDNGDIYNVVGFRVDPADALKILYLRKV